MYFFVTIFYLRYFKLSRKLQILQLCLYLFVLTCRNEAHNFIMILFVHHNIKRKFVYFPCNMNDPIPKLCILGFINFNLTDLYLFLLVIFDNLSQFCTTLVLNHLQNYFMQNSIFFSTFYNLVNSQS